MSGRTLGKSRRWERRGRSRQSLRPRASVPPRGAGERPWRDRVVLSSPYRVVVSDHDGEMLAQGLGLFEVVKMAAWRRSNTPTAITRLPLTSLPPASGPSHLRRYAEMNQELSAVNEGDAVLSRPCLGIGHLERSVAVWLQHFRADATGTVPAARARPTANSVWPCLRSRPYSASRHTECDPAS